MDLRERTAVANRLVALDQLPARVTAALDALHPEWLARYGEGGRQKCMEDARFHLSFLAGAIAAGRPEAFAEYIRWAKAILAARKIDGAHLCEQLSVMETELASVLGAAEATLVAEYLEAARRTFFERSAATPPPVQDAREPTRLAYLNMALGGRRVQAYEIARDALLRGWSQEVVYRELLLAGQRRLGELWAEGSISIAQEHMASAVTQWTLARLYQEVPLHPPTLGRVLIAGAEGELHTLAAHFAADLLELKGWEVLLAGTNVPTPAILSAIAAYQPAFVGLSVTMPFNLVRTLAITRAIADTYPNVVIVLGGRAVRGASDLGAESGVLIDAAGDLGPFFEVGAARPATT